MSGVKGSKQYRSVVVQDSPGARWLARCGYLLVVLLVVVIAYWRGGVELREEHQRLSQSFEQTQSDLASTRLQLQELQQQLTNANVGAQVDRQAVNEVRNVISEHKQTINALNEEIGFYKGLMAPTERERGLSIRSWELYPGGDAQSFQFKLVMQQLALKHLVLKGAVSVNIVGKLAGEEKVLSLSSLSTQVAKPDIRLRFKYFQSLDGELQLPEGFVPERVDIIARATTPTVVKVEKHYGWIVQRSAA